MSAKLIHGDCLDVLAGMESESCHSCVTDPPYELGFMGKAWDGTGIAYNVDLWREVLRVLKPGGHLIAFGGSRTYHRLAVAVEDAGFEIRDQGLWLYGSGFPKSLDVSKAIDKAAGAERDKTMVPTKPGNLPEQAGAIALGATGMRDISAPATDDARKWNGWGTALKPAHEPFVIARKPFPGTVAANVLEHGTGAINVDGCRVESTGDVSGWSKTGSKESENRSMSGKNYRRAAKPDNPDGRFPANLIHDGSEAVRGLFPATGAAKRSQRGEGKGASAAFGVYGGASTERGHNDNGGSAARYFYCAKASRAEREAGLDHLDPATGAEACDRTEGSAGLDNPRAGAGRTASTVRNIHPTVKPLSLMRYLVRLVTPPGGTVLEPFAGSGTTLVACVHEGFGAIGIELTEDYLPIINGRVAHAEKGKSGRLL